MEHYYGHTPTCREGSFDRPGTVSPGRDPAGLGGMGRGEVPPGGTVAGRLGYASIEEGRHYLAWHRDGPGPGAPSTLGREAGTAPPTIPIRQPSKSRVNRQPCQLRRSTGRNGAPSSIRCSRRNWNSTSW